MNEYILKYLFDVRHDVIMPTNLKIYNKIGMVTIDPHDIGSHSRSLYECEINSMVYKSVSRLYSNDIYIPAEELRRGCIMNIREQKKTYFIKTRGILNLYVYVWKLPYKEDAEYSVKEAYEFLKHNKPPRLCFSTLPKKFLKATN